MKIKSLALSALILASGSAAAVPVEYSGTVLNNWRNYSLIHQGANPSGTGSRRNWLRFEAGQSISFFYDSDTSILNTAGLGAQSFDLFSRNGASATFELLSLDLDLNDVDGFLSGSMAYNITNVSGGSIGNVSGGLFTFDNINMGVFNSVNFVGDVLDQAFLWGGDTANRVGIDFSFNGARVPEPSALLLLGVGLAGLGFSAKRKSKA